jgi:hypothetical protein
MAGELAARGGLAGDSPAGLWWWMWPAWKLGTLRSGLREATAGDAIRLRRWPSFIGAVLLPGVAVGLPLLVSALHATTPHGFSPPPDQITMVIADVFTESLPFMALALALGIASPALGVLAVAVYAVSDLAVTVASEELDPILGATFGRVIEYWLLWFLIVTIPLLGRFVTQWQIRDDAASSSRRWSSVLVGAVTVAALTFMWAQAAPLLINVVFTTASMWGSPTVAAVAALQLSGHFLVVAAAASALLLLAAHFAGHGAVLDPPVGAQPLILPGGPIAAKLLSAVLAFALFVGIIKQPVDALILIAGLLLSRPVATLLLRATRLGPPLAGIQWPIRLVIGFAAAAAVDWAFIAIAGYSDVSPFFNMIVAIAIALVVVQFFLVADEVSQRKSASIPMAGTVATVALWLWLVLVALAVPAAVLADNGGDHVDGWAAASAAAGAAAGAAGVAGAANARRSGWPASVDKLYDAYKDAADAADRGEPGSIARKDAAEKALNDAMDRVKKFENYKQTGRYEKPK